MNTETNKHLYKHKNTTKVKFEFDHKNFAMNLSSLEWNQEIADQACDI